MKPLRVLAALLCAVFLITLPNAAYGQEKKYPVDMTKDMGLPEGAKLELIGEYESPIPGYAKVQCLRLTLKSGTKVENFTAPAHSFCNLENGQLRVVTLDGKEMTVKAGATWVDPKGFTYKLIHNTGKSDAQDTMFMLLEEQAKKQDR